MKPEWLKLKVERRIEILKQVSDMSGLPADAVEKDWWVTFALKACFELPCAEHLVFKGGTSLSKAWNLIERFSEDIDLVIDRKFLGFEGELSKTQIGKLRKKSCEYISNDFVTALQKKFKEYETDSESKIAVQPADMPDKDPQVIEVHYHSAFESSAYLKQQVLIEIGARSLTEPRSNKEINSIISSTIAKQLYSGKPFLVPTVEPHRTFLEKIFLLHEEFSLPQEKIRVERLSRHLYDLEKLMDTEHGQKALGDFDLFMSIVRHREKYTPIRQLDYSTHTPDRISIIPPAIVIEAWEKDYKAMTGYMIYGEAKKFEVLIKRIEVLQERVRNIKTK